MEKKENKTAKGSDGHRKFGLADKIAYAAGDFGCNMSFALKGTVQTFWLVFMMLDTGLLSVLLLIVQIWDAVNDPLIGNLIDNDRRSYKYGKFKTYIFIGACGLLFAGAAVFLPFPNASVAVKSVLYVFGYILWDAFYTVANVPYGSMLSLITEDSGERAQLSTWRSIGSMLGTIIPTVILPLLIWEKVLYDGTGEFHTNPLTNEPYEIGDEILDPLTGTAKEVLLGNRVFLAALLMGIIGFAAFMFMLKTITIRGNENSVKANKKQDKFSILQSFGKFMKNRPAVGATVAAMGMFLGMQSATTANTIMFATYFNKAYLSGLIQLAGFVPVLFFIPFIKKLTDRFGKKEAAAAGTVISLIGSVIMLFFPAVESRNTALVIYLVGLTFYGLGSGVFTCVSWAVMADAIDYNEWKFGVREEGTVYSLHSFFRKLSQGIGPSAVLVVMGLLGYEAELGTIGQSAQTAKNMCYLVAGLYLLSAVIMLVGIGIICNMDKKTLAKMTSELEKSRKTDEAQGEQ